MPISRRLFLRSGAQALSAASLLGAVPGLAAATDSDHKSVSAHDISVKDVSGLAVFAGAAATSCGAGRPGWRAAGRWRPGGEFRACC